MDKELSEHHFWDHRWWFVIGRVWVEVVHAQVLARPITLGVCECQVNGFYLAFGLTRV